MRALAVAAAVAAAALTPGCAGSAPKPSEPAGAAQPDILFEGLGRHGRPVTTTSAEAQRYFDQGLAFVYGFNHDEAIRSFRKAGSLDPKCAMAFWGLALANGPHINFPMVPEDRARAAWDALGQARALAGAAKEVERAMIDALGKRYAWPQPADRKPLDKAYANAMREVWRAHPDDADVGALFAEALMDLRPWDLWTSGGQPQPGTDEIVGTLETVLAKSPTHALANHLYIHAVEASPHPEKAAAAADRLRTLQPGLGHMVHMPSHIDVRRGRWRQAITANLAAIEADRVYRAKRPQQEFYRLYMAHDFHMAAHAAMMIGRGEQAVRLVRQMLAGMPAAWMKESATIADGFVAMPFEVLMRFGMWGEILAEPEPPPYLPYARALRLYARGVAQAARARLDDAQREQKAFREARTRVPRDAAFGNNNMADLLDIADHLLAGEILFRQGQQDAGIVEMTKAAAAEDRLRYDEPPDWIQPIRHAFGAALLESGRTKEAEAVYRQDLATYPHNVWSLHGLARSLRLQKRDAEAAPVESALATALEGADITLTSSCMCLPGV